MKSYIFVVLAITIVLFISGCKEEVIEIADKEGFIIYSSWEFGQKDDITIFHNGSVSGWKGPMEGGIPVRGALSQQQLETFQSLLKNYDFARLKPTQEECVLPDCICEGGSTLIINFENKVRQFDTGCQCIPEKSCEFVSKVSEMLLTAANEFVGEASCGLAQDIYYQNNCYAELAIKTANTRLCEEIEVLNNDATTKNRCYTEIAKTTVDASLCENIGQEQYNTAEKARVQCLYLVSFNVKDVQERKNVCDKMPEDITLWIDLTSQGEIHAGREGCYYRLAFHTKNVEFCAALRPENRQRCSDFFRQMGWA